MDANDFLMQGGTPAVKFPVIGTTVIGVITKPPKMAQITDPATNEVKRWQNGEPQMQVIIEMMTEENDPAIPDDNGERTLWAKGVMKNAIRDAVRRSGSAGLEVGGVLQVTFTAEQPNKNPKLHPQKLFAAHYVPPQQAPVNIPADPWEPPPTQVAAAPARMANVQQAVRAPTPAPNAAVAQSFMDRLRSQAQKSTGTQPVNHRGEPQDDEPPY